MYVYLFCDCYVEEHNMYYFQFLLEKKDIKSLTICTKYFSASLKHLRIVFLLP